MRSRRVATVGINIGLGLGLLLASANAGNREDPGALNNEAIRLHAEGRYADGIPLARRALEIYERVLEPNHPWIATALTTLAGLYQGQGRLAEAEPLFVRALSINLTALAPNDPLLAKSLNNLALLYFEQERYAESEPLYLRALRIDEEAFGVDHLEVAVDLNNLGLLYRLQRRYAEAQSLYERALKLRRAAYGESHPEVALSLNNLASLYQDQKRYAEAQSYYQKALDIRAATLGIDHPYVAATLNNLADLSFEQGNWAKAAQYWQQSTDLISIGSQRDRDTVGQAVTSRGQSAAQRSTWQFAGLIKANFRVAPQDPAKVDAMFQAAQWAQFSSAAASLSQMAARSASRNPQLDAVVRKRQDLLAEWHSRDAVRTYAASQPPSERNTRAEQTNLRRFAEIELQLRAIDKRLARDFEEYDGLVSANTLSVADVQAYLAENEALVLFLETPDWKPTTEETFIWVVSKTDAQWVRSETGMTMLNREVAALRCGLDFAGAWLAQNSECAALTNVTYAESDYNAGKPLPFDATRAYKLYASLFGQIEKLIEGKVLLVVPTGALTRLPFHVMVTQPPGADGLDPGKLAWLARKHAITVLPAVSSLKALRKNASPSHASKPFLGIGNPLLDGEDASHLELKQAALANKTCDAVSKKMTAGARGLARPQRVANSLRLANVDDIRKASPLPETADELCSVAQALGANDDDILLGARATERKIKSMSAAGALANYRTIDFSTHGATVGSVTGMSEPGLILTPPQQGSDADDGYLSAGEIAGLKLDADWVILSACNTAAPGSADAQALSGLARAFFYAGSRSVLVSHWYVDSDATVALITGAFAELQKAGMPRSEALRQSMLALINQNRPPSQWGPFVVVGEGSR